MNEISPAEDIEFKDDRRKNQRTLTLFRVVHIDHERDEGLGTCRNISDSGLKLSLSMDVEVGDLLKVRFSPSHCVQGRVVWRRDGDCGLRFDPPIDSSSLLADMLAETQRPDARGHRFAINRNATLIREGEALEVTICDISQRGVKIRHQASLRRDAPVTIKIAQDMERRAVVRWADADFAGLMLLEPLSVSALGSMKDW